MAKTEKKTTPRRAMHVQVSADIHQQWHDFATENAVSVSALIETIPALFKQKALMSGVIEAGQQIDAKRRRRQP